MAFASAFFNKLLLTTCADVECVNNERYFNIQMQPSTRVHSSCSTRHGTEKAWRWVRSSAVLILLFFLMINDFFNLSGCVSDPVSLNPDLDPGLLWIRLRIQVQVFDDKKLKKLHYNIEEASRPPKRTSSTSKHEFSSFLFWVIFCLPSWTETQCWPIRYSLGEKLNKNMDEK